MSPNTDELRRELRSLYERYASGDVPERIFQKQIGEMSVELSRAVVRDRLSPGETLLAEHHLIHSRLKLTQSILEEPEQAIASFFASDRAIYRVNGALLRGRIVSCDQADSTTVESLSYEGIRQLVPRRETRWGEAMTGLVIVLVALTFRDALALTGPLLLVLGVLGTLHGLLLPTRWIEIVPHGDHPSPSWALHGVHRRSARKLVTVLRRALGAAECRVIP